jgi:hypothetical protein
MAPTGADEGDFGPVFIEYDGAGCEVRLGICHSNPYRS